jgi:adenine C2-methylase RlmN of 23S rRNA A2503 and tRNA A37
MCDGVNDRLEHAEQLVRLLGPGWRVKFTRLNPTAGSLLRPASQARVDQFREVLENGGLSTNCSQTDESGIGSGCGQLSYHFIRGDGNKAIDGCIQIDGFTG